MVIEMSEKQEQLELNTWLGEDERKRFIPPAVFPKPL
jgi:hypothetical protein